MIHKCKEVLFIQEISETEFQTAVINSKGRITMTQKGACYSHSIQLNYAF